MEIKVKSNQDIMYELRKTIAIEEKVQALKERHGFMTKDEAIQAMKEGKTVAHSGFTEKEWMKQYGSGYIFEDGVKCSKQEFWHNRTQDYWEKGWRVVGEKK